MDSDFELDLDAMVAEADGHHLLQVLFPLHISLVESCLHLYL